MSTNEAKRLFEYRGDLGVLIWKNRPAQDFKTIGAAKSWNTRFSGKVAGGCHKCTVGKTYYILRCNNELYYAHRIIWSIENGELSDQDQIDHIDGDGTNNRIENLRKVSLLENKKNLKLFSTNTTGHCGVSFVKKRGCYEAYGSMHDKKVNLGYFKTLENAVAARKKFTEDNDYFHRHGEKRSL